MTGPLSSISAGRLYVGYQRTDGWLDVDTGPGPNTDDRSNDRNAFTLRGQYLITPSDDIDFLLIADYSKRNEVCCDAVATVLGPFAGIANALAATPRSAAMRVPSASRPGTAITHFPIIPGGSSARHGRLRTTRLEFRFAKLTSITAWRDSTLIDGNDTDYTAVDILFEPATNGNLTDFKQSSEELRLAGKDGPLDWLVGAFFANETLTNTDPMGRE